MAYPTTVAATDEQYTTLFATELHDDQHYYGFGANPQSGVAGAHSGKVGLNYYFVTNTATSGAGSFDAARSSASSGGGGWIVFQVSGTWILTTTTRNLPANTVLDARGQNVTFITRGFDCAAARPVIANVYINAVTASGDRGIDLDGNGPLAGFFPNIRMRGDIADQGWNIGIGAVTTNGMSITISNWRMDDRPSTTGFDAGANVGSSGTGNANNARGNDKTWVTWHHMYTEPGVNIRVPITVGCYSHIMCGYHGWTSEGMTFRSDALGSVGRGWIDHPTLHTTTSDATKQDRGVYVSTGTAHVNIEGTVRKLGTTGDANESSAASVVNPATYYTYARHEASQGAAHDTFMVNRSGNVEQVTISGTAHPTIAESAVSGATFIFTLAGNRTWVTPWSTTEQNAFIAALKGFDATTIFTASDIVRTSATVVTATASSDADLSEDVVIYFEGGTSVVTEETGELDTVKSWNHVTITNEAPGSEQPPLPDPDPRPSQRGQRSRRLAA